MKRILAFVVLIVVAGGVFSISPLKDKFLEWAKSRSGEQVFVHEGKVRLTTSGNVEGAQVANGTLAWKGIPFAQPPLGTLRWAPPKAPFPWAGVRQTQERGPDCYQFGRLTDDGPDAALHNNRPESEDCLYLDVYAPRHTTSLDRLPVLFWIHGGDNVLGRSPDLSASLLVANHPVVVVVPNFRLGGFGWFAHEALRKTGSPSANFGLQDLVAALNWTQDNVLVFGGDPGNVTLVGETSGADTILALLASPALQERAPFHKAAIGNATARTYPLALAEGFTRSDANSANEVIARLMIKDALVSSRQEAARQISGMEPEALIRYLRAKSANDFMAAYERSVDTAPLQIPTLIGDGVTIPTKRLSDILDTPGGYTTVPMILGANRDQAKSDMMGDEAYVTYNTLQSPIPKDLLSYEKIAHYQSEAMRLIGVDELARTMSNQGRADLFVYRFDWDDQPILLGTDYSFLQGAAKGVEVPFLLGDFHTVGALSEGRDQGLARLFVRDNERGRQTLSEAMMAYWVGFATQGKPGRGTTGQLPDWEPWQRARGSAKHIVFDTTADGGIRMSEVAVSGESLTAEIAADKSLPTALQKCAMADFLNARYRIWSPDEMSKMFAGACLK